MGRIPYSNKATTVHEIIKKYPGISKGVLMSLLGYTNSNGAESILACCETNKLLLSEDEQGRLYTWSIEDSE
jgi:hypothetical protein